MSRFLISVKKYIRNVDHYLLILPIICSIYGLVLIYSATYKFDTNRFMLVQGGAIVIGIIGFLIASLIDFNELSFFWKWVFGLNFLLVASLFFLGVSGDTGNKSWIRFAGIGIQPAEIGKILFIFTLSKHIEILKNNLNHIVNLSKLSMHLLAMCGAIVVFSSDDGMAISYFFIFIVMLFVAGLNFKWIFGGSLLVVASVPFIWNFVLRDYQKLRILVIFDPSLDPDKAYHANQSKIALGAGGITGTGYLQGNQTQYGLLPAKHTDFIFSVAGEEFGLIGCSMIILLLSLIILRLFYVSYKANTLFSSLMCAGIAGMLMFQTFQNILMCLGIMPIIGLTLPFFSYGGSSIVTTFTALGIASGIRMREKPSWLQ